MKRNSVLPLNTKNQLFIVEKTIFDLEWNEEIKRKTVDFWSRRSFKFDQITENGFSAKRGRWLGNLISNDLNYKMARLTIVNSLRDLYCSMQIDTRWFAMSDWYSTWWNFEIVTFETFLLHGDENLEQWRDFKKDYQSAYSNWSFNYNGIPLPMDDIYEQKYKKVLLSQSQTKQNPSNY